MPTLTGTVLSRGAIDPSTQDLLYGLFTRYYLHADRATFDRDIEEKDWVLLLTDGAGALRGFTTLKLYDLEFLGRRVRAVFNGNTIIERDFWGEQQLVATWCRFMADLKAREPAVPLYWYLISSGYRTYLFLPLFFHDFHPRHDRETPAFERSLADHLGRMKFPQEYSQGLIHVTRPRECLLEELASPPPAKLRNPHVRFFLERNPGYCRGDELVCLAEYSLANTRRTARKALLKALDAGEEAREAFRAPRVA